MLRNMQMQTCRGKKSVASCWSKLLYVHELVAVTSGHFALVRQISSRSHRLRSLDDRLHFRLSF